MSFRDSRRLETAIESLREESRSADVSDATRARMAQLLAVWASGYLEVSCRDALVAYTRKRADPSVVKYVQRKLKRFPSPKLNNIIAEISNFDEVVANDIESFAEGQIGESVNSIVAIRNQIAHGRPSSVSLARMGAYVDDATRLVKRIQHMVDGSRQSESVRRDAWPPEQ